MDLSTPTLVGATVLLACTSSGINVRKTYLSQEMLDVSACDSVYRDVVELRVVLRRAGSEKLTNLLRVFQCGKTSPTYWTARDTLLRAALSSIVGWNSGEDNAWQYSRYVGCEVRF